MRRSSKSEPKDIETECEAKFRNVNIILGLFEAFWGFLRLFGAFWGFLEFSGLCFGFRNRNPKTLRENECECSEEFVRFGAFWCVLVRFGAFWRVLVRFGMLFDEYFSIGK